MKDGFNVGRVFVRDVGNGSLLISAPGDGTKLVLRDAMALAVALAELANAVDNMLEIPEFLRAENRPKPRVIETDECFIHGAHALGRECPQCAGAYTDDDPLDEDPLA